MTKNKDLTPKQQQELINTLRERFEKNPRRHEGIDWAKVEAKLRTQDEKLRALGEMERTGGEPDVVGYFETTKEFIFVDCCPESPKERRSLCYDNEALEARKANKPKDSAQGKAYAMGIELLGEVDYRELQKLGTFDSKTSSWLKTPENIRKLGGAIYGDYRYGQVFIYHNGADSYYASRGFRGWVGV